MMHEVLRSLNEKPVVHNLLHALGVTFILLVIFENEHLHYKLPEFHLTFHPKFLYK